MKWPEYADPSDFFIDNMESIIPGAQVLNVTPKPLTKRILMGTPKRTPGIQYPKGPSTHKIDRVLGPQYH